MQTIKGYIALFSAALMLTATAAPQTALAQTTPKKGWSGKAKGAAIGGGAGVVGGAVVGGTKGAVVGGLAGAAAGGLIGRNKDKKKNTVRYQQYSKK
jgi:osmotically inducible lipoprotein OsmB